MKKLFIVTSLVCWVFTLSAQDYHVRFGFLGNSITIGSGLAKPKEECYPSQIAKMLVEKYGDTCSVSNYAVSGRTMLKKGDYPLWDEPLFQRGWVEAPDICFIMLGTNDTKPYNWDVYGDEFQADYLAMMDTFKLRNPNVKFIVCYPPPAFDVVWDIRNEVVVNGVIPVVDTVLAARNAILVDFYNPLVDSVHLFPDKIHPNAAGAKVMAKIAFDKIVASDIVHQVVSNGTYVTGFKTDEEEIRQGDSVVLSWVTRNAQSVFLNGEVVEAIGSKKVAPKSTTDYWLLAKGDVKNDSLMLNQLVYIPALDKLALDPNRAKIKKGETIDFKVTYYDQRMRKITNETFPGTWEIIEGEGALSNVSDTSVTFEGKAAGKAKLQIMANNVAASVSVTIEETTDVLDVKEGSKAYPNPCVNGLIIPFSNKTLLKLNVYDVSGKKVSSELVNFETQNKQLIVDTKRLPKGIYIYNLVCNDVLLSGKFIRK